MKLPSRWSRASPKIISWFSLVVLGACGLLSYKLGSLCGALAANETFLPTAKFSLHGLWNHPLLLPLGLSRLLVAAILPFGGQTASRIPSALLGLSSLLLLSWLLRRWYGWRVALFGGIMVAISPWFLHAARLANPAIVYCLAMIILLCVYALYHQQSLRLRYFMTCNLLLIWLLYIPGFIWLVLPVIMFEQETIRRLSRRAGSKLMTANGLLAIAGLVPLLHALIAQPRLYSQILGFPRRWAAPLTILKAIARVPYNIFLRGPLDPTLNLGRLPLVNIFTTAMFLVGIYLYAQHLSASRTHLLAVLAVMATILVGLGGSVSIIVLLPIIFLVASGGLGYLLHLWLKVFPRNPLARSVGIGLVALTLSFSGLYNLRQYFIAWPDAPATQAAFQRKQ